MSENRNIEYKSIRFLKGKNTNWDELAKDCVCFANGQGGYIYIGIEDGASEIKRLLRELVTKGLLSTQGERKWMKYSIKQNKSENV